MLVLNLAGTEKKVGSYNPKGRATLPEMSQCCHPVQGEKIALSRADLKSKSAFLRIFFSGRHLLSRWKGQFNYKVQIDPFLLTKH